MVRTVRPADPTRFLNRWLWGDEEREEVGEGLFGLVCCGLFGFIYAGALYIFTRKVLL